ncbi:MAG: hypothetical protein A2V83_01085 [Nitrospirae bacterium RBG_16_64_22]|nr:MAG: hypothetical protein A2V83_01085 [Nitrospirae bacterium RBG_16_64_22]
MSEDTALGTVFIVSTVLLFVLLSVAGLLIVDHRTRIPGGPKEGWFDLSGPRRNHPLPALIVAGALIFVIGSLLVLITAAHLREAGFFRDLDPPEILAKVRAERILERLRRFHNLPASDPLTKGRKTACFHCHGDFPHSKEPMMRSLLNMHTQFVGCMTCHADDRKVPEKSLRLRWVNASGVKVEGQPFGLDNDPVTGGLKPTDDYYSQIVAYAEVGGKEGLLEILDDSPETRDFLGNRDRMSDQDREAIKKAFHRLVSPKGRLCTRCHTDPEESYLPYRALGFSESRIKDLTHMNIIGLVEKYREFYVPTLLKSEKSLPSTETLAGPRRPRPGPSSELKRDPRSWWRQTYDAPDGER